MDCACKPLSTLASIPWYISMRYAHHPHSGICMKYDMVHVPAGKLPRSPCCCQAAEHPLPPEQHPQVHCWDLLPRHVCDMHVLISISAILLHIASPGECCQKPFAVSIASRHGVQMPGYDIFSGSHRLQTGSEQSQSILLTLGLLQRTAEPRFQSERPLPSPADPERCQQRAVWLPAPAAAAEQPVQCLLPGKLHTHPGPRVQCIQRLCAGLPEQHQRPAQLDLGRCLPGGEVLRFPGCMQMSLVFRAAAARGLTACWLSCLL